MKGFLICLFAVSFVQPCIGKQTKKNTRLQNLTQYVNPYIGTSGHGHTFLGANVPFGLVQLGPSNYTRGWDWCSGYHYSDWWLYNRRFHAFPHHGLRSGLVPGHPAHASTPGQPGHCLRLRGHRPGHPRGRLAQRTERRQTANPHRQAHRADPDGTQRRRTRRRPASARPGGVRPSRPVAMGGGRGRGS